MGKVSRLPVAQRILRDRDIASRLYTRCWAFRRHDFADQAQFSQYLHRQGSLNQDSVKATESHIVECCGSTDDVLRIKVVSVLHQMLIEDGTTLEAWRSSPFKCPKMFNSNLPRALFFARLWLHSTAYLFGDEVLSLRDVEKDCAVRLSWSGALLTAFSLLPRASPAPPPLLLLSLPLQSTPTHPSRVMRTLCIGTAVRFM
jgi:hypothetical protein